MLMESGGRGRLKKLWEDVTASDMRRVGISEEDAEDKIRIKWESRSRMTGPK